MTNFLRITVSILTGTIFFMTRPAQKDFSNRGQSRLFTAVSIGLPDAKKDEDKPYLFSSILSADVDQAGNIYALDYKEACVKVFDAAGRFLRRFLSPGQGPGEAMKPLRLKVSPDGNRILVLHLNGFQIKEFDGTGDLVQVYTLPKQMFGYFDFLDDERLLMVDGLPFGQKSFANLKVLGLRERKFEKEFAWATQDYFISFQKFVIKDETIWTCPGDTMKLKSYDLRSGTLLKTITLPENYVPYQNIRWGQNIQTTRVSNYAQPFDLSGNLYVVVTRQRFTRKPEGLLDSPLGREIGLYRVDGDRLVKEPGLPAFDFYPDFHASRNKRVVISSSAYDLYPRLAILEIRE